jgi:hypothetical protein
MAVGTGLASVSEFRQFCTNKWYEHKDEIFDWTKKFPEYDSTYYFGKHRWLLKTMFLDEQKGLKETDDGINLFLKGSALQLDHEGKQRKD